MSENRVCDVLDECLMLIGSGEATIQECLAMYPDLADELAPLLSTATAVAKTADIEIDPSFKAAARARILAKTAAPEELVGSGRGRFAARAVVVASAAAIALSSIVYASASSAPGDWLYPLKKAFIQSTTTGVPNVSPKADVKDSEKQAERGKSEGKGKNDAAANGHKDKPKTKTPETEPTPEPIADPGTEPVTPPPSVVITPPNAAPSLPEEYLPPGLQDTKPDKPGQQDDWVPPGQAKKQQNDSNLPPESDVKQDKGNGKK